MNEDLIPSAAPDPVSTVPVIALPPDPDPTPVPDPTLPPMEVISVDELLERLTPEDAAPAEEPGEELADVPGAAVDPGAAVADEVVIHLVDLVTGLGRIEGHLKEIKLDVGTLEEVINHPALTTSFSEYTVTEALLLFLLLAAFLSACARMLRGGLSWLRS